jgi:hypothetical protein
MEPKTRNLILVLELLLLATAALVTFIDYGLKRDLLNMIAEAREHLGQEHDSGGSDSHAILHSSLLGNTSVMEAPVNTPANGVTRKTSTPRKRAAPGGRPGNGDSPVPADDKPVGP